MHRLRAHTGGWIGTLVGLLFHFAGGLAQAQSQDPVDPAEMRQIVRRICENMRTAELVILQSGDRGEVSDDGAEGQAARERRGRQVQHQILADIDELIEAARREKSASKTSCSQCSKPSCASCSKRPSPDSRQESSAPRPKELGRIEREAVGVQSEPVVPTKVGQSQPDLSTPAGNWGSLPKKVEERIRAIEPTHVPLKHRKWIEQYLRRLNDVERESR